MDYKDSAAKLYNIKLKTKQMEKIETLRVAIK